MEVERRNVEIEKIVNLKLLELHFTVCNYTNSELYRAISRYEVKKAIAEM